MGCLCKLNNKTSIIVITSNKNLSKLYEKDDDGSKADQTNTYQQINNEDINSQTILSQNVEHLIENNPIPFVKIKKKKMLK